MDNKKLLDHLTRTLREMESGYRPGAWEKFNSIKNADRSSAVLWPRYLMRIAAAIILFLTILLYLNFDKNKEALKFAKKSRGNLPERNTGNIVPATTGLTAIPENLIHLKVLKLAANTDFTGRSPVVEVVKDSNVTRTDTKTNLTQAATAGVPESSSAAQVIKIQLYNKKKVLKNFCWRKSRNREAQSLQKRIRWLIPQINTGVLTLP